MSEYKAGTLKVEIVGGNIGGGSSEGSGGVTEERVNELIMETLNEVIPFLIDRIETLSYEKADLQFVENELQTKAPYEELLRVSTNVTNLTSRVTAIEVQLK